MAGMRRRQRPGSSHTAAASSRFAIDLERGLLPAARQVESPNCDDRPPGMAPELIVVHGISLPPGEFGGPWIDLLFTNRLPRDAHPYFDSIAELRVSSHLLIRRDGELVQYVPFHRRAWHAGPSSWLGRERCNDFSIGIELEGTDHDPYESTQYAMLGRVIAVLCRSYPSLSPDRIAGHSEIAPGRKTDPGLSFDWPLARALVRFELEVGPTSA
ncbi:MAG TPA: 1,6-anhydro-N-acetylmuramyl-L-alanine amidase AmpD [Steroidobacteraceae bacterium]|nr:1,6-anhydro-N-acetylmuramyl-L-alanine amidase AmpD [Steroidobacteraceae bacterium]